MISRAALFRIGLALVAYGAFEAVASVGLVALRWQGQLERLERPPFVLRESHRAGIRAMAADRGKYYMYSSKLGWTIRPGGNNQLYRANASGFRATRDYSLEPAAGVVRLASFGDSFTHCSDVEASDTWQQIIEDFDPDVEALNFGVDAYGLDQSFLRYLEDGRQFWPRVVVIGMMTENINRNVNTFRPFYFDGTGAPLSKPRFILEGKQLHLLPNPLDELSEYDELLNDPDSVIPRLGEHDHYYHVRNERSLAGALPSVRLMRLAFQVSAGRDPMWPGFVDGRYDVESEAFKLTDALMASFAEAAREHGSIPLIVLFPNRDDLERERAGAPRSYAPLLETLEGRAERYIDPLRPLADAAAVNERPLFTDGGHYTRVGNTVIARSILRAVREIGADDGERSSRLTTNR